MGTGQTRQLAPHAVGSSLARQEFVPHAWWVAAQTHACAERSHVPGWGHCADWSQPGTQVPFEHQFPERHGCVASHPAEPPADAEPPAEPPAVEPPADPPDVEPPAEPPDVEPPAEPPADEPPAEPPDVEPPADPPDVEPPADPPDVEPPADPPDAEPPADPPDAEPPADPPPPGVTELGAQSPAAHTVPTKHVRHVDPLAPHASFALPG